MLTERQKQMIEGYIPSPKDNTLDPFEYYFMPDGSTRIFKVYISDIYPGEHETTYGCHYSSNGNRVHTWREFDGIPKRELYDNKEDCKNMTHSFFNQWEELRELQEEEGR